MKIYRFLGPLQWAMCKTGNITQETRNGKNHFNFSFSMTQQTKKLNDSTWYNLIANLKLS